MSPTSLNRPIIEKGCIYNLSFFVCACLVDGGHFQKSKAYCDLENGVKVTKI